MFEKVLIAEDHESTSISIQQTLAELGVKHKDYVYYCDDALLRIEKAQQDNKPYELLITNLNFEEDDRTQNITCGIKLIIEAKRLQPNLKILVFSAVNKAAVIDVLSKDLGINGYVRKARRDAQELKLAIQTISKNKQHISDDLKKLVKQKNTHEFNEFDIAIISLLSNGTFQKDIPAHLDRIKIKPSGLSSIEKRLNLTKTVLGFFKNEQLIAYCKDMGIV